MNTYQLLKSIIEDADHIKASEYNTRYWMMSNTLGIYDQEIYDLLRDIDSGGYGYAFQKLIAGSISKEIQVLLFVITLRSAKMPPILKTTNDIKYLLLMSGTDQIAKWMDLNYSLVVQECLNFKNIQSVEAGEYLVALMRKWFCNSEVTSDEITKLYNMNVFNTLLTLNQITDPLLLDTSKFLIKLSTASTSEFNGVFFGKVFQKIMGNNAFVYEARMNDDSYISISYLKKNKEYKSKITELSTPAHGIDWTKNCFTLEKKFTSQEDLVKFIAEIDQENVISNKQLINSPQIQTILKNKFKDITITQDEINFNGEYYKKPVYTVNTNRDKIKLEYNTILFNIIDVFLNG